MSSTRRHFLRIGAAAAGAIALDPFLSVGLGLSPRATASTQLPQIPLDGTSIPKFVDALPTFVGARVQAADVTVAAHELQQQVLPTGFPATWVWGYKVNSSGPLYPGFTVEARRHVPTTFTYLNNLPTAGSQVQRRVTVDQTLAWANPLGLAENDPARTRPYVGPPPIVGHLHGGEVASQFDGGPGHWYTPDGRRGPSFSSLAGVPAPVNGAVYRYPNAQEAATIWFHDHAFGATRLNVYAGLAAFYLLRDEYDTGLPSNPLRLPAGAQEIEIAFQDRMFDTGGQLIFPDGQPEGLNGPPPNPSVHPFWNPEFFGDVIVVNGKAWPYLNVEPRRYRFRLLGGSNARFYSLSLVNSATGVAGPDIWQIGTDDGLLDAPVRLSSLLLAPGERADVIVDFAGCQGQTLVVRNTANTPYPDGDPPDPRTTGQIMQLRVGATISGGADLTYNPALGAPLRGGVGLMPPIVRLVSPATGAPAAGVVPSVKRQLTLIEEEGDGGPLEMLVNNTKMDGRRAGTAVPVDGAVRVGSGMDYLTELPRVGATEQWEIVNLTVDAHPMHLHLTSFQILNRQAIDADGYRLAYEGAFPGGVFAAGYGPPRPYGAANADGALGGNPPIGPYLRGAAAPPLPNEAGWKDTAVAYPGQVTRLLVRFTPQDVAVGATDGLNLYPFNVSDGPGYVWHCHIVDHEDNEMMRPYAVLGATGVDRARLPFPSTPVLDDFNRPNGGLGANWSGNKSGYYAVDDNQARALNQGYVVWNAATFGADQEAHFTFTDVSQSAAEQDLILKAVGPIDGTALPTSLIEAWYDRAAGLVRVVTRAPNPQGWVDRGAVPASFGAGDLFGARALADGRVQLYKRAAGAPAAQLLGTLDVTAGPTPWPPALVVGGGKIGVWFVRTSFGPAADAHFDNFGGGTLQ